MAVRPGSSHDGHVRRGAGAAVVAAVCLAANLAAAAGPAGQLPSAAAAVQPCSNGLVALTFDDGPAPDVTPKLVDLLTRAKVPATFFMVGERVAAAPSLAKTVYDHGFVIGNHSWAHESLPSLSDNGVRSTIQRTDGALRKAGVHPSSLVRPPYGAVSDRVISVIKGMGLTPVLWDVDPRNWESGSSADITARVLGALRPHGHNIVLMHDGVARSSITLAAVPGVISGARARGYCFAELGSAGDPVPPVPALRVSDAHAKEADPGTGERLVFGLQLDRPTSRPVSVRVRTHGGSAESGEDFRPVDSRVTFPAGTTQRQVTVWVRGDRIDETRERLHLVLDAPKDLTIADKRGTGTIFDDDPWPKVRLSDVTVTEPTDGSTMAHVPIRMDRLRSHKVVLKVGTVAGEADETDYVPVERKVVLPAGTRRTDFPVKVLADDVDDPEETFEVRVLSAGGARVADGTATVTILPAPLPPTPE